MREYTSSGSLDALLHNDSLIKISTKPLRRVITRSSTRVNGRFASRKMKKSIPWESQLEKYFLLIAEMDPTVKAIYAQATTLDVCTEGVNWHHIPDFILETKYGIEIHEIKPERKINDPLTFEKLKQASIVAHQKGCIYSISTEVDIYEKHLHDNVKFLRLFLHKNITEHLHKIIIKIVIDANNVLCNQLVEFIRPYGGCINSIFTLAAQGSLIFDLKCPIGPNSTIWTPETYPGDPRITPLRVPTHSSHD